MKKVVLFIFIFVTACAKYPVYVNPKFEQVLQHPDCYILEHSIPVEQPIIYRYQEYKKGNRAGADHMFTYSIDNYIHLNETNIEGKPTCTISKINTNYLFYSDTGAIADGISLEMTVLIQVGDEALKKIDFKDAHRSEFYSGFVATKNRRAQEINSVLIHIFQNFNRAIGAQLKNLGY